MGVNCISVFFNFSFEIDDLEKEWIWCIKFDFIFVCMMFGCFEDFLGMIKVVYDNFEFGGYFEF